MAWDLFISYIGFCNEQIRLRASSKGTPAADGVADKNDIIRTVNAGWLLKSPYKYTGCTAA